MTNNERSSYIQGLIQTPQSTFSNEDLGEFKNNIQELWTEFIQYMPEHNGTLESDFKNFETVGYYINEFIDFIVEDDKKSSNLYQNIAKVIKGGNDSDKNIDLSKPAGVKDGINYYWNESVNKAIAKFLLNFDLKYNSRYEERDGTQDFDPNNDNEPITLENGIKVGGTIGNFLWSDIANADAGLNLKDDGIVNPAGPPWVRPQYNIDGRLYKYVRGVDKIISVLNSNKEMQFTETQGTKDEPHWLRLLMPKYLRYVEVEDLNRNFWVIGQTITAICSFLFDDDSPIKDLIKDILDELPQLWENVFYLWLTTAAISQKPKYTTVHVEEVFLPNKAEQPYLKFDNFSDAKGIIYNDNEKTELAEVPVDYEEIKASLRYLIDQYPNDNLCIVPKIRFNNYKKNYYSGICVPALLFYDRNLDRYYYTPFNKPIIYDMKNFEIQNRAYALHEDEDTYWYHYPLSNDVQEETRKVYYGLGQLIISLDVKYILSSNSFDIRSGSIYLVDRAKKVALNQANFLSGISLLARNQTVVKEGSIISVMTTEVHEIEQNEVEPTEVNIERGYYQGELLSYWRFTELIKYLFDMNNVDVLSYFSSRDYEKEAESNIESQIKNFLRERYGTESSTGENVYKIISEDYLPYALELQKKFFYGGEYSGNFIIGEDRNGEKTRSCYSQWYQNDDASIKRWTGMRNDQVLNFILKYNFDAQGRPVGYTVPADGNSEGLEYCGLDAIKFKGGYRFFDTNGQILHSTVYNDMTFIELLSTVGYICEANDQIRSYLVNNTKKGDGTDLDLREYEPYLKLELVMQKDEQDYGITIETQLRYNHIYNTNANDATKYLLRQYELYKSMLSIGCQEVNNAEKIIEDYTTNSFLTEGWSYRYLTQEDITQQNNYYRDKEIPVELDLSDETDFIAIPGTNKYALTLKGYDKICCLNKVIKKMDELADNDNNKQRCFYQSSAWRSTGTAIGWNTIGTNTCILNEKELVAEGQNQSREYCLENATFPLIGEYNQGGFSSAMCIITPELDDNITSEKKRRAIYYDGYLVYDNATKANADLAFITRTTPNVADGVGLSYNYTNLFNFTQNPFGRNNEGVIERQITGEAGGSQWLVYTEHGAPLTKDNWLLVNVSFTYSADAKLIGSYSEEISPTETKTYYNCEYIPFDLLQTKSICGGKDNPILIKDYLKQIKEEYFGNSALRNWNFDDLNDGTNINDFNNALQTNGYMYFGAKTEGETINRKKSDKDDALVWLSMAQKYNDIADYEGYINGEYAFITGYYIVHQKVAIFAPNGEYSVTYYNRDTNPASSNYLKWVKYKVVGKKFDNGIWTDRTTFQDEIDRTDYIEISNDLPGYDYETFKSNGKEVAYIYKLVNGALQQEADYPV